MAQQSLRIFGAKISNLTPLFSVQFCISFFKGFSNMCLWHIKTCLSWCQRHQKRWYRVIEKVFSRIQALFMFVFFKFSNNSYFHKLKQIHHTTTNLRHVVYLFQLMKQLDRNLMFYHNYGQSYLGQHLITLWLYQPNLNGMSNFALTKTKPVSKHFDPYQIRRISIH